MVLHTTFAGLKLASTGGTTYDTVTSTGYYPTGDSEIQVRGGGLPRLIGVDSYSGEETQIGATTNYDFVRIGCNTWPTADYITMHPFKQPNTEAKFGWSRAQGGQPLWMLPGRQMDQDADWEVRVNTTTASMSILAAMYLSYGTMYPYRGGDIVSRQVEFASDDGVYPATGTDATITDLDPRFIYRVHGIQLNNVEDKEHLCASVTSSSNTTRVGALLGSVTATTFHPNDCPVWFPHDSILISGVETVIISSSGSEAQKPNLTIFFEKYGGTSGAGIGGATAAVPRTTGTGGIGGFNLGGLGSALFGR